MSSLAFPRKRARRKAASAALPAFLTQRGSEVLLACAVLAIGTVLLGFLPGSFSVDSWLALTAGRDVWNLGLPHVETLTVLSYGAHWYDQQWLSEWLSYGLYLAGGLALLGVISVGLIVAAVAGSIVGARRLGAQPLAVMLVLPLCAFLMIPFREVRTQEFAMPLFVAVAYLLARDSRAPSRRVYWCVPLLVLWGNLHGTVTLGMGLVMLRGLTLLWDRHGALLHSAAAWRRPLVLIVAAPLSLLATPYGLSLLSYYHTMFLESSIRDAVTEWQPITSSWLTAIPFFILAAYTLWSWGRNSSTTTLWDRLALIALAAGSIEVIRNVLFFALCAMMLVPLSVELPARKQRVSSALADARRGRINAVVLLAALASLLVGVAAAFTQPASTLGLGGYEQLPLLRTVERATAANPSLKVLTDTHFADWLVWRDPALRGRVANDARFELLTPKQITQTQEVFDAIGPNWKRGARGFGLIVLDRHFDSLAATGFLDELGARVLYRDDGQLVILRSPQETG
jgi:hypothetical protein